MKTKRFGKIEFQYDENLIVHFITEDEDVTQNDRRKAHYCAWINGLYVCGYRPNEYDDYDDCFDC